jgi:hypothetical protein
LVLVLNPTTTPAKRAEGKKRAEAMRWLKRRLSDLVFRALRHHLHRRLKAAPGTSLGGDSYIQRV